ncbi:unnamed protein product, partial [Mesorhabditis belari]|uniref:RING-type domain-containing protein n=1 Tax=Mesorhabditis belari TaxID=2138241 RepID=A0AAF3EVN4_9BILA
MGIKDFWRKHKNKKIAKKDEKLLKRLQELNIDSDDLLQAPVVLVERRENDERLLTRLDDLEKRLEGIQRRNGEDLEENGESDDGDLPGPSMNAMESRKSTIQPVQINNYYLVPGNELTNQQNSTNLFQSAEEIEIQRKREQEKEDEEFARLLQLELEEEEFWTFRREREERATLATLAEDEDQEKIAQRRQIDKDAEFAWSLHFREETTSEALEPNDEVPIMSATPTSASMSQREENLAEVPEFVRRANEIQRRLAGNPTPKGVGSSTALITTSTRRKGQAERQGGNSSSAVEVEVNEEEVKAINEQIENDAALARALAEAENEFFERHHLGTRNRHSTGNDEQLERFTELVVSFGRIVMLINNSNRTYPLMLLSDSELNESDDEGNKNLDEEIDGKRSSDDHCVICLEDEIMDAVGCAKCRQLLGCRHCVLNWYRGGTGDDFSTALWFVVAGDQNYKSCPLCRVRWGNQPELINLQHRQS